MWPKLFELARAYAPAKALLQDGQGPFRFYAFGSAPQAEQRPYAVWQVEGGNPENYLNRRPDIDGMRIQIDTYAVTQVIATQVYEALRDAIEGRCHITFFRAMGQDKDTKLYRFAFIVDWFANR